MADSWVDLGDAIRSLREQLTEAIDEGRDKGMHFRLAPIDLTVQAAVTARGNGKVGWKILEVGGSLESASTQTLTLKLTPVWTTPGGAVVEDPLISATVPPAVGGDPASPDAWAGAGHERDPVDPD